MLCALECTSILKSLKMSSGTRGSALNGSVGATHRAWEHRGAALETHLCRPVLSGDKSPVGPARTMSDGDGGAPRPRLSSGRGSPTMSAVVTPDSPSSGAPVCVLSGAKDKAFPHIPQPWSKRCKPTFDGTPAEFLKAYGKERLECKRATSETKSAGAALAEQLRNRVRRCPNCSKVNAVTLTDCNSCGTRLPEEVSFTNNVFTGFIFGIARGPFPFTISLRHESESLLVFDDLLQLSTCHVNCIPTDCYIPDLRVLFEMPKRGLALVRRMVAAVWGVVEGQFLSNPEWVRKTLRTGADKPDALRKHLVSGFNFPPSQFQLHLQAMLPPFTPFHYGMYLRGRHFTYGRFFPVEYVLAALELQKPMRGAADRPVSDTVRFFNDLGVRYDTYWKDTYARFGTSHNALSNWDGKDFTHVVVEPGAGQPSRVVPADFAEAKEGTTCPTAQALQKQDKLCLQNYGRPYSKEGRPVGTYYKFAKKPPLPLFAEMADPSEGKNASPTGAAPARKVEIK